MLPALYAKVTDVLTDGSLGSSSSTIAGVEFFTKLTSMLRYAAALLAQKLAVRITRLSTDLTSRRPASPVERYHPLGVVRDPPLRFQGRRARGPRASGCSEPKIHCTSTSSIGMRFGSRRGATHVHHVGRSGVADDPRVVVCFQW
jgi:hypothetical protein